VTLEQLHAELRFEPGDVLTDRRLSPPQLSGKRAQIPRLTRSNQDAQIFERHISNNYC
jgi:hypothetical protein